MGTWEALYKGHSIRIEKGLFARRLIIDGELKAGHSGLDANVQLIARITNENGLGEPIIAKLEGLLRPRCELVIHDSPIPLTKGPSLQSGAV